MPDLTWAALVVFGGYVVLGLTGFGSALVIVPLLTWQWPLSHVVALTLLLDLPACLLASQHLELETSALGRNQADVAGHAAGQWRRFMADECSGASLAFIDAGSVCVFYGF